MFSGEVSRDDDIRRHEGGNSQETVPRSTAGAAGVPPVFPAAAVASGGVFQGLVAGPHSSGRGVLSQRLHLRGRGRGPAWARHIWLSTQVGMQCIAVML
jgi:hypothetical protein